MQSGAWQVVKLNGKPENVQRNVGEEKEKTPKEKDNDDAFMFPN